MPCIERMPDPDFWSDTYRGHLNHHGRWHAYLDHMFQPKAVFASAENARWLAQRVDLAPRHAA
jgi:hypothetical protein